MISKASADDLFASEGMQAMTSVRAPGVAGQFYPGDPVILRHWVADFTSQAPTAPMPLKAIIAPHAGYPYSGPIAGTAYAAVRHLADQIRRVVLLGPAHRHGFRGLAVPTEDAQATPLGVIPIDRAAVDSVLTLPGVQRLDRAFAGEHALEVHLPFLQQVFPDFQLVPLLVGDARPEQVDAVLERLWDGPETLIVISSDLSHYQDYATARQLDRTAVHAIETLQGERLNGDLACGYLPICGLLRRAAALDLRATTLDLRNSGDTAGGRDQVVGYGAFGFEPAAAARLSPADRAHLLEVARQALRHAALTGRPLAVDAEAEPWTLRAARSTFVTLTQQGNLRGCIGSLAAGSPLVVDVAENTFRAAMQDPRFGAITADEVGATDVAISILSHARPMTFADEAELLAQLQPGVDGLILKDGSHQALFLPKVWQALPEPAAFVSQLKQKAGLRANHFSPSLRALRFTTETFGAED
jgi:hypothetical protein